MYSVITSTVVLYLEFKKNFYSYYILKNNQPLPPNQSKRIPRNMYYRYLINYNRYLCAIDNIFYIWTYILTNKNWLLLCNVLMFTNQCLFVISVDLITGEDQCGDFVLWDLQWEDSRSTGLLQGKRGKETHGQWIPPLSCQWSLTFPPPHSCPNPCCKRFKISRPPPRRKGERNPQSVTTSPIVSMVTEPPLFNCRTNPCSKRFMISMRMGERKLWSVNTSPIVLPTPPHHQSLPVSKFIHFNFF